MFNDASLLPRDLDGPIEFEVSIGNYGNKLDPDVPPCSSTTTPTHAVFDGHAYRYLPWDLEKPMATIDSHWEDISFRLETLNHLLKVVDRLEDRIKMIRIAIDEKQEVIVLAKMIIDALDELLGACGRCGMVEGVEDEYAASTASSFPLLVDPIEGIHRANDLDKAMRSRRQTTLTSIVQDASHLRQSATDVGEALGRMEEYLNMLVDLAVEPQASMPDVIVWMLVADKRVAFVRVPAHDILYAEARATSTAHPQHAVDGSGRFCGKLRTLVLEYPERKRGGDDRLEIPATIRARLWLGLFDQRQKFEGVEEGRVSFAHTLEFCLYWVAMAAAAWSVYTMFWCGLEHR